MFYKRLLEERKRLNKSQDDMCEFLAVTPPTYGSWERGKRSMPSDKIEMLVGAGFDIAYMMTGVRSGSVTENTTESPIYINNYNLKSGNVTTFSNGRIEVAEGVFVDINDYAWLPLYDVKVSAGNGSFFVNENILTWISFTKYSLRKHGLAAKDLAAVKVHGDSMYDTLKPNDTIIVNITKCSPDGGIFVLRVGDMLHVKRLIVEKDVIRVISDNPRYDAWSLNRGDDFEIIGKYEWHGRYAE